MYEAVATNFGSYKRALRSFCCSDEVRTTLIQISNHIPAEIVYDHGRGQLKRRERGKEGGQDGPGAAGGGEE